MKRVWFKVVEDFGLKFGLDAMPTAIVDDDVDEDG